MSRVDQYGDQVPDDLVLLPAPEFFDDAGILAVKQARWYELDGRWLAASFKEMGGISEDDPADAGLDVNTCRIERVSEALKRWSEEDGFYHA